MNYKFKVGDVVYIRGNVTDVDKDDDDLTYLVDLDSGGEEEWFNEKYLLNQLDLTPMGKVLRGDDE